MFPFVKVVSRLSQYDLSVSTFSPDGRVFQTDYAQKAIDNSGCAAHWTTTALHLCGAGVKVFVVRCRTVVGLKCKDGVVLVSNPCALLMDVYIESMYASVRHLQGPYCKSWTSCSCS